MLKLLLFFYAASVLVFFILFMSIENEYRETCKIYSLQPEKRSVFSRVTDTVSLLAFSLVPGLRVVLLWMVAYGVSAKKEKLKKEAENIEKKEGAKENEICSYF